MAIKIATELSCLVFLAVLLPNANCQYYLEEEKICAIFYSQENYLGDKFNFKDKDQSINLADDRHTSDSGWNTTGSLKIEGGCALELCNDTYFDGECVNLIASHIHSTGKNFINLTRIVSARCVCQKECKCEDIHMKKNSCARAYLYQGCGTCNAFYANLRGESDSFPEKYIESVKAFRIRKGCTLTVFPEEDWEGEAEVFNEEIVEDYNGSLNSYRCECDPNEWEEPVKPPRPKSFPPLIDVPGNLDDVIKMLKNSTYKTHPGLRAAFSSLVKKRSSKNAYILLLGSTGAGKSSTINLLFDNPNVTKVGDDISTTTDIHEFRIPVPIDEIGVSNSELRVIDTPGLGDTRGLQQDAKFLATLDAYLSNHEELKDRIPNVVLIFHQFHDNRFGGDGSKFVRMLRGLDTFRKRITDENFSNVVFVFSHFCSETNKITRKPDNKLNRFKSVIENYSLFPKPTIISVGENKADDYSLMMLNGYHQLPNQEFYPRNLFEKMELVTEKGGDTIGLGVFCSAFRDSTNFNVTSSRFHLLNDGAGNKLEYYMRVLTNSVFSIQTTEISQLLQATWNNYMTNKDLKKNHPLSLSYLQKSLSIRGITTKSDVPQARFEILELLTAIKHDKATRELLWKALKLRAPDFPQNTIVGYSYNVIKDRVLFSSPFRMDENEGSDIGFMLPSVLTCNRDPSNKENFLVFDDKSSYIEHRLRSLGIIAGAIPESNFTGKVKPGHNIREISFTETSCSLSATKEFRLYQFVLNEHQALTPEFTYAVTNLTSFNASDYPNVDKWKKFFEDFGTHVVGSAYVGGSIEIQLKSDKPFSGEIAESLFNLVKFAEDMSYLVDDDEQRNGTETKSVLSNGTSHRLKFKGGDHNLHTADLTKMTLEAASKLIEKWKKSLRYNPTVLSTELTLIPISKIAKKIGQKYATEIEKASILLFNSELTYIPPKKPEPTAADRENTKLISELMKARAEDLKVITTLMERIVKLQNETSMQNEKKAEQQRKEYEQEKINKLLKIEREREPIRRTRFYEPICETVISNGPSSCTTMNSGSGSCLREGTTILMADMSRKPVEHLEVGDLILDKDFKTTTVVGVSFEFLLGQKFYGFDDKSFFFTQSHLFVGPTSSNQLHKDFNLYSQNASHLFQLNPLMKYLHVSDMAKAAPAPGDRASWETSKLFHIENFDNDDVVTSHTLSDLEEKEIQVYEDPESSYPKTPVYFIQVDSPTGTYFANGYVCRHEIPPVEHWPNTMALLFRLMETQTFSTVTEMPYNMETVYEMDKITTDIADVVKKYITNNNLEGSGAINGKLTPKIMTLQDIDMDESISKIFTNPTVASMALNIYSKVGVILAPLLDSETGSSFSGNLAVTQQNLLQLLETQLTRQLVKLK